MNKTIFYYGLAMAALVAAMKFVEYQFLLKDLAIEIYVGIVAVFFTIIGIWAGLRLTRKKIVIPSTPFNLDNALLDRMGISKREYEVLQLIAGGHSNREIADKLFVSINTVKTHSSNLFVKLDASRRTQAIQKAKQLGLIP